MCQQDLQQSTNMSFQKRYDQFLRESKQKSVENTELQLVIDQLTHTVADKRILDEVSRDRTGQLQKLKMQRIVRRRRLVEQARANAQQIANLHAELERMRMRTFPALTTASNNA